MERLKIKGVTVLTPEKRIKQGGILIEKGIIKEIFSGDLECEAEVKDGKGLYLAPGFVDLHVHGGGGSDFMDGTAEACYKIARTHMIHGTTSMLPTTLAGSFEEIARTVEAYRQVKEKTGGSQFLGLHFEGPYVARKQAGALDPAFIKNPVPKEYEAWVAMWGDDLARWTGAPELPGMMEFSTRLRNNGILPSIGHTDATSRQTEEAYRRGFTHMTHLYSAMSTVHRENGFRTAGALEGAFLTDGMTVELIADGCHLPESLLRLTYKWKGSENIALVTDAMRAAGQTVPESVLGSLEKGQRVLIEDGVAKMPDRQAFAGSIATADRLVRTMVKEAGVPLTEAVKMMTETPVRILSESSGKTIRKGKIEKGMDADFLLFDQDIQIQEVYIGGKKVFAK